jgi:hypothetical protein
MSMKSGQYNPGLVRNTGVVCAGIALAAILLGIANARVHQPARDVTVLIPCGIYFLIASVGTMMFRKVAAILVAVPLVLIGASAVVASIRGGPLVAIVLNLLLTGPLFSAPAVILYRNWRCLR